MRPVLLLLALQTICGGTLWALEKNLETVDFPTVLKLAGAQNLEIETAEEKLREAQAREDSTLWQLFPTISPGVAYQNHSGMLQSFGGPVSDVNKESIQAGATVSIHLELAESIYRRLAAQQLALAATHQLESQRQHTLLDAATGYFELAGSQAIEAANAEAVNIAQDFYRQVQAAVRAGLTTKGDELRAYAQLSRSRLAYQKAVDARHVAASRLAQTLRLNISGELRAADQHPAPLSLTPPTNNLNDLIMLAVQRRPEIAEAEAINAAAQENSNAARYAPLYPTLNAQVFGGGLGGSTSSSQTSFGRSTDTLVSLTWKIGAGGLFDTTRERATQAAEAQSRLAQERIRETVTREVVEAQSAVQVLQIQLQDATAGVKATQEGLQLAMKRREFAVGAVLETLQSQQDAVQSQQDYWRTVTELNKAQYRLKAAVGQ
jgi:outer membrane protein TolC